MPPWFGLARHAYYGHPWCCWGPSPVLLLPLLWFVALLALAYASYKHFEGPPKKRRRDFESLLLALLALLLMLGLLGWLWPLGPAYPYYVHLISPWLLFLVLIGALILTFV